ncbi:MAG: type IV toxin-antitoxin system AbiEi family antitoxin [Candidatus Cloacimonetes bacterium]|nr:type IV toxin-antitoxin system AbiEi family antitoxin [Candidatus Cloacimonadota bacterium]
MSTQNRKKINYLITHWERGVIYTQKYLSRLGYNKDLIKKYFKNNWIERIGRGAFILKNDDIDWLGGVYTLQKQLNFNINISARTALELQGYGHYVYVGKNKQYLSGRHNIQLPMWFKNYSWDVKYLYKTTSLFPDKLETSFTYIIHKTFKVKISSPERAILEMLHIVPYEQSFDETSKIMENLMTLRPALLDQLLINCNSIKVKRMFLYLAENLNMPWFDELSLEQIYLGKGKRSIVKNGRYDPKYKITVPQL